MTTSADTFVPSADALFSMTVLLASPEGITSERLEQDIKQKIPSAKFEKSQESETAWLITVFNISFAVMLVDKPYPLQPIKALIATGSQPVEAGLIEAAETNTAHLIIAPLPKPPHQGAAIMQAMELTRLSALVASLGAPIAFYWGSSEIIYSVEKFADALAGVTQATTLQRNRQPGAGGALPSALWVSARTYSPDQKQQFGMISKGLSSFTGYEIELLPSQCKPIELAQWLYGLVTYLFNNGPVLNAGETIGVTEQAEFKIHLVEATAERSGRLQLQRV